MVIKTSDVFCNSVIRVVQQVSANKYSESLYARDFNLHLILFKQNIIKR